MDVLKPSARLPSISLAILLLAPGCPNRSGGRDGGGTVPPPPQESAHIYAVLDTGDLIAYDARSLQPLPLTPLDVRPSLTIRTAYDPTNQRLWLVHSGSGGIQVIDTTTLTHVSGSPLVNATTIGDVVFEEARGRMWATSNRRGDLLGFDATTMTEIPSSPVTTGWGPHEIEYDPITDRIFAATNGIINEIWIHDAGSLAPVPGSPLPLTLRPVGMTASPPLGRLFLWSGRGLASSIRVWDTDTLNELSGSPFPTDELGQVSVDWERAKLYAVAYDGWLRVYDAFTLAEESVSPMPIRNMTRVIAFERGSDRIFLGSDAIQVLDAGALVEDPSSPIDIQPAFTVYGLATE